MDPQEFIASWDRHYRVQAAALALLPAFAIAASYLTVAWIRANRRHLDDVWPTMMFSGLAAVPGLALFAELAVRVLLERLGIRLHLSLPYQWPTTLACSLWILVGPVLLFVATGPARPEDPIPKGLIFVQASHAALWLASSVLAFGFVAEI